MLKPWLLKIVGMMVLGVSLLAGYAMPATVKAISGETPPATSLPAPSVANANGPNWCDIDVRCEITEPDQLEELYATVGARLDEFRLYTYAAMPDVRWLYVGEGYTSDCVPSADSSSDFYHCAKDNSVVIHEKPAWDLYQYYSTSPLVIMAHEWAHNIHSWRLDYLRKNDKTQYGNESKVSSFVREQQADCVAGAFFGWLQGYEDPQTFASDADDARRLMVNLSSDGKSSRTHGNAQERVSSFDFGWHGGLSACNRAVDKDGSDVEGVRIYN